MRVVLLGAGGPAGVNVAKALKAAGRYIVGTDENPHHLIFAQPWCDELIVTPPLTDPSFTAVLTTAFGDVDDVVHSQHEPGILWLARNGHRLAGDGEHAATVCVPSPAVIETCQDKVETAIAWGNAGLRSFYPCRIYNDKTREWLWRSVEAFGLPFWLRATHGAGARGATLVNDLHTGYHWIRYWQTRNSEFEWVAEEYLPGRDFCWTSLWQNGQLIAGFARERLEWMYPHLAPSGRTGTPSVAVTVHDERVSNVARRAVLAIDPEPHGIYAVDLREDRDGQPRPTEINAGRWPTTSPLYHELGANLCDLHIRIATGEHVEPVGDNIYPANIHLFRHIDCPAQFIHRDDLIPDADQRSYSCAA